MRQRLHRIGYCLLALLAWGGLPTHLFGSIEPVVAVLSSDSGPYQEALAGVRETLGRPVTVVNLAKGEKPPPSKVVIAIGGKAAVSSYPADSTLIYCVAPGVVVGHDHHPGPQVKVYVSPAPSILVPKLKELQPALARLGVLWISEASAGYTEGLKAEGEKAGVSIRSERLRSADDLPDHLRAIKSQVDALWLPPDPLLITPQTFGVLREFSLSNHIPLYVPMDGLAEKGAAAAISITFRDMGRKAGSVAAQALAGSLEKTEVVYVDKVTVTINATSALQSGLLIPSGVLKKADRVVP